MTSNETAAPYMQSAYVSGLYGGLGAAMTTVGIAIAQSPTNGDTFGMLMAVAGTGLVTISVSGFLRQMRLARTTI